MDLRLNENQEMLSKSARDFLAAECPKAKVRELEDSEKGYSPEMWKKMAELGWMGLIIPEKYEGMGMDFQDLTVLLEEMGRNVLPGPFLSTIACVFPILDVGTEKQKTDFLPRIARGELILTPALVEAEGTFNASGIALKAAPEGEHFVLNGTKLFVEMAHVADYLVCAVRTKRATPASAEDGVTIFLVDAKAPGIACEVIPTIASDKLCEVRFKDVLVPKENLLGELNEGWPVVERLLQKGAIAKCAESVGGMQASIDMTVAYMKDRVQYDRPIGAFQALQHLIADQWMAMETSKYLVYQAAWRQSEGLPCTREASMAKTYTGEAYQQLTKWAVRLHGGIGTSRDHDISLYYRRAKTADTSFGGSDYHSEVVAEEIGLK